MNTVMKTDDVIGIVHENRKRHNETYVKARAGWLADIQAWFVEQHRRSLETGGKFETYFKDQKPSHHLDEYDRALQMLNANVAETVELTPSDYSNYVRDEWTWKDQFVNSTAKYLE